MRYIYAFLLLSLSIFDVKGADLKVDKPNVLMISVDDMNDWVSFLNNYQSIKTPNLDRLAAKGMAFTNAYCAAPLCNPSRTAIFTGLAPARSGVVTNSRDINGAWKLRWPNLETLPLKFKNSGYRVVGGGKTYHETVPELFNPLHQWDEYFPLEIEKFKQKPHVKRLGITDREWFTDMPSHPNGSWDWGPFFCDDFEMGDGKTTKWAMDFVSKDHDKPFFLALGLFHPHLPFYAPKKYFDKIPLDSVRIPEAPYWDLEDLPTGAEQFMKAGVDKGFKMVVESGELRTAIRAYLASILYVDALVGEMMTALESSQYADNTIVIFWSDHGYQFGEKERFAKRSLWQRSTRVMFTMHVPELTEADQVCSKPVSLLDIYPTLIDLCNLEAPDHPLDGISIKPQLLNLETERNPAVITHGIGNDAVCSERYTYIKYSDGGEELYDRLEDPNQWCSLADKAKYRSLMDSLNIYTTKEQGVELYPITEKRDLKE